MLFLNLGASVPAIINYNTGKEEEMSDDKRALPKSAKTYIKLYTVQSQSSRLKRYTFGFLGIAGFLYYTSRYFQKENMDKMVQKEMEYQAYLDRKEELAKQVAG